MGLCSSVEIASHLQERQRLEVDVIIAWRAAWLAHIAYHDGDAALVRVWVAVAAKAARLAPDLIALSARSISIGCQR